MSLKMPASCAYRLTPRANRRKEGWGKLRATLTVPAIREMSAHLWEEPNQMLDTDDLALWCALNRLMANYWADVDHNGGSQAHEFYLPEALFAVGNNRFEGPEKIRAFYARRRQHGTTTTRHLVGNLRVLRDDARCVRTFGVMPLPRRRPPTLSVDKTARDDCGFRSPMRARRRQLWRFQSHVLRPIFVGSDLPASIWIDPQRL